MNESDVADFLLTHPDFFARHAELLGHIRLGNPHGTRAISLPERQSELLREKNRQYERRLGELVRYGHENDSLGMKIDRWSASLLAENAPERLIDLVCTGLRTTFDVPQAAVRLWRVGSHVNANIGAHASGQAAPTISHSMGGSGSDGQAPLYVSDADAEQFANKLAAPYCGENKGFAAAAWLSQDGATPADTASIALVPLRAPHADPAAGTFGLLALGSPDAQRFHTAMGTEFLTRIGTLASAALSRLLPTST